jgi:putative endonuclease
MPEAFSVAGSPERLVLVVGEGRAMVRVKDAVGRFGEQVAARHLEEAGFVLLDRNWRCAEGEIDIVATDGEVLVLCEVKTRSGLAYGDPAEAVGAAKAARLRRLALRWMAGQDVRWRKLRFDVVTVLRRPREGPPVVRHLRGAF